MTDIATPFPGAAAGLASDALDAARQKITEVERDIPRIRAKGTFTQRGLAELRAKQLQGVENVITNAEAEADRLTQITTDDYARRYDELTLAPDSTADQLKVSRRADLVNFVLQRTDAADISGLVSKLAADGDLHTRNALRESAGPILAVRSSAHDGNKLVELGVLQADATLQALSRNRNQAEKARAVLRSNARYVRGRLAWTVSADMGGYQSMGQYL